jgi:hypothetical protein
MYIKNKGGFDKISISNESVSVIMICILIELSLNESLYTM